MGCCYVDPKTAFPVYNLLHETLGKVEIALPRTEKKTGNKHQDFQVTFGEGVSLEEDLRRRDFTINSMAMDLQGRLIDPFDGFSDLEAQILLHTSEAFSEDPLRVYRALRFATHGYFIDPKLKQLIKETLVSDVPVERVFHEMMKAMKQQFPEKFFYYLILLNVGFELFTEVHEMPLFPAGPEQYHGEETVYDHCVNCLQDVSFKTKDPVVRLAAFLHDLGKVDTPVERLPHHPGHDTDSNAVDRFLTRLKADNHTIKVCTTVAQEHMKYARLPEMRTNKQLKMLYTLKTNHSLHAMDLLVQTDQKSVNNEELRKIGFACTKSLDMNVTELGLDVDDLRTRPGKTIASMVQQARIKKVRELLRDTI